MKQKRVVFCIFVTVLSSAFLHFSAKGETEMKKKKVALITGVTGQDGKYLSEFLLEKGYEVHGIKRRSSSFNTERIDHLLADENFKLHHGDMTDSSCLYALIQRIRPDEVYNLAAQSHVQVSFEIPEYTAQSDALGTLRLLEAIRACGLTETRFYQASTSEMFGKVQEIPQRETTPFYPRSPYGAAKVYAFWITVNYREAYNIFACNGILFNHESPVRGETFVTRKITRHVAEVAYGEKPILFLGNLDAKRDWGYAKEFVEAMWMILQYDTPQDWVVATGKTHTVREFVERAFKRIGIELLWQGSGVDEKGYNAQTGEVLIAIDKRYFRPTEVELLIGDPSKAKNLLGWEPKITFEGLVDLMVDADLKALKKKRGFNDSYKTEDQFFGDISTKQRSLNV